MEVGKVIKNARNNSGYTQEDAAEQLSVSRQTISNWENCRSLPDIVSVIKMSDLYNISLDELLKGDQKMMEKIENDMEMLEEQKYNKKRVAQFALMSSLLLIITLIKGYLKNNISIVSVVDITQVVFLILITFSYYLNTIFISKEFEEKRERLAYVTDILYIGLSLLYIVECFVYKDSSYTVNIIFLILGVFLLVCALGSLLVKCRIIILEKEIEELNEEIDDETEND